MTTKNSEVLVTGMTCSSCARRVQRALEATEGVRSAQVDLTSGRVTIEHDDQATNEDFARAVEKSGYQVRTTEASS